MSSLREAYESRRYPYYVHALTDPARLAALGRILGVPAADPRAARVLDLGCGSGTGLLALAARLPDSQFLGLDFSAPDIASARELAAEAGLTNVEFRQEDLLTWQPGGERYDYIIAYGVFSWVPDEVKDRLLQLCAGCLASGGIACVSYMTWPGCKQAEALRDLLRLRTESCGTPEEKLAVAHEVLHFLDRAYAATPGQPHAGHLLEEVRRIRQKEPHYLLHDELGSQRDPCYLLQFAGWAAEHGLRYLGESEFHMMLLENLPPETARELVAMKLDRLETEQFIDYIVNRSFRCSLLAGPEAPAATGLDAAVLRGLAFSPRLQPSNGKVRPDAAEAEFSTAGKDSVTLRSLPLVAFVRALAALPGAFTPYAAVRAAAVRLAGREFTVAEEARLCEDLLTLFGRRQVELSAVPFTPPAELSGRPALSPLNLALARRRGMVVTAFQESIRLSAEEQAFCLLLDGTRSPAEFTASREARALDGKPAAMLKVLSQAGCMVP